jgi:hypothetical protein
VSIRWLVAAVCLVLSFAALADRVTPSSRLSNVTHTSGAHTASADIPATSTFAVIYFCGFDDDGLHSPTSVTLDGQSATLIDESGTTGVTQSAIYKVAGFATGSGKTLGYTLSATGNWFIADFAIEYRTGTPVYGAHGAGNTPGDGTASTSSLANTSGDEIISGTCYTDANGVSSVGTGQSKLDETHDTTGTTYFGFTTETGTGSGDVQSVGGGTAHNSSIASTVVGLSSPPAFSAAPAIGTRTTSSIPITMMSACTDCTFYGVAYTDGASTPSCTQIKAGHDSANAAAYKSFSTAVSANVTVTGTFSTYTDGTVRDSAYCLNSTANGDSSVSTVADLYKIPAFTTPLSVASQTDTVFTSNSKVLDGAGTVHWVRCPAAGTAPSVAQVEAHGGACITDSNTDDATGTMTLTVASRTPKNDLYYVGTYGGQHEAAVHTLAAEFLDAPTGLGQIVMAAGPYQVPCLDYNALYSPAIATDTTIEFPLAATTGNAVVGNLTVANDCTTVFDPGGDLTRRGFENWKIYTGGNSLNSDDIDAWFYDPNIITPNALLTAFVLKTDVAVGVSPNPNIIIWQSGAGTERLCYHPLEDAVTVTKSAGTEPTGLSLVAGAYTGTVVAANENEAGTTLTMRCTSNVTSGSVEFPIIIYPVTSWAMVDCLSVPTTLSECADEVLILTHGAATIVASGLGNVSSQSPAASAALVPYGTVTLSGTQTAPNCLLNTVLDCQNQVTLVSPSALFTASTGCTSDSSVIYTQGPAAYTAIADVNTFELIVFCR